MPSVDLGAEVALRPTSLSPPQPLRKRTASACSLAANSRARSACSPAWAARDPPCSAMPSCTRATSTPSLATASANSATCARSVWRCARVCSTRASGSGLLGSGSAIEEPEYPPTREVYPPPRTTPWLLHPSHHPEPGRCDPWTGPSVRAGSVAHRDHSGTSGHYRSPTAKRSVWSTSLQLRQLAQRQAADQMVVPKVRLGASGSRRAATDRRRDRHDAWRTVVDRRTARALTPSFTCRFPTILPDL